MAEGFLLQLYNLWTEEITQRQPSRKYFKKSWFIIENLGFLQFAGGN